MVVLQDTPVGYWRLGESSPADPATDLSGSGHNGSYIGPVMVGQPGALIGDPDTGVQFASDQANYVLFGDIFDFDGHAPFSIEAWVNPARQGISQHLFTKEDRGFGVKGWALVINNDGTPRLER